MQPVSNNSNGPTQEPQNITPFRPIEQLRIRMADTKAESDYAFFQSLLLFGEAISKTVVSALVAAIKDDPERNRYRLTYKLVRADGIGEWAEALDDVLLGPASQQLAVSAALERRQLTEKVTSGAWQHEAVANLVKAIELLEIEYEEIPVKVDLRKWFHLFAHLRNKTRGHGAHLSAVFSPACEPMHSAIEQIVENFNLFRRSWAHLHRNLSGKYRVTTLGGDPAPFEKFRQSKSEHLPNGLYVVFDEPNRVELMSANEQFDFFFANGSFKSKDFEMLSYATGEKVRTGSADYLLPTGHLPESETQGLGKLDLKGKTFCNLPPERGSYIPRSELETELSDALKDDRRNIVTLVGRGGIGKTSLCLRVLNNICPTGEFDVIVWFSARDIDLLETGPKTVQPHVLTETDIAREFVDLVEPAERLTKGFKAQSYFESFLGKGQLGRSLLVFDNFETARNPQQLFKWIDTFLRPPNKALITTRFREFKGDYFIEVGGMTEAECDQLVQTTSFSLRISNLITPEYRQALYQESEGHPYVVKVLLGEVAKSKRLVAIERIVATRDDILTALFERTYASLSPTAQRVFLTLCSWTSAVSTVALEAILLRPENERMDVSSGIDELVRSSMVEVLQSEGDQQLFLNVPLVAAVFGKQKLKVSSLKSAVQVDAELLMLMGPTSRSDVRKGIEARVRRLFQGIAGKIEKGEGKLETYVPILESIARSYPAAWLTLAEMYEEQRWDEAAKNALEQYLQNAPGSHVTSFTWKKLADLCGKTDDALGEVSALIEAAQFPNVSFQFLSGVANRVNRVIKTRLRVDSSEKQVLVRRLAEVMAARADEAESGSDLSPLGWLFMHLGERDRARQFAEEGLRMEPNHQYCEQVLATLDSRRAD